MIAVLLLTLAFVLVSAILGQGVLAVCGWDRWRWWSPAVGLSVLLIVGGQVSRLPHRATGAALVILVLTILALLVPGTRRGLREAASVGVPLAILVLLLAAVPMFAYGLLGPYGTSVSNDMSQHLATAWYLRTHLGLLPVAAIGGSLVTSGYPIGGHGLVAAIVSGTGMKEIGAFDVMTLAVPVMTAFAAYGALSRTPRAGRWTVAALIGLCYLPAAYLAQGQFKETIQALLLLAGAVALDDMVRARRTSVIGALGIGAPFGLLIAGGVYNYSYGALFWMAGAAGFVVFLEFVRGGHGGRMAMIRAAVLPAVGLGLTTLIVLAPEIRRVNKFTHSIFGVESLHNHGNLPHAVNPFEALGVWLSGDFRRVSHPVWPSAVLQGIAALALLGGLVWWWRRRRIAPPAAAFAGVLIWVDLALTRNIYNAAKGLIVAAPVLALCIAGPLLAAWSARRRDSRHPGALTAVRVVGVVLLVGAAISSLAVLRSTIVGLGQQTEFASFRHTIGSGSVLFLGTDHYAEWELRGTTVYSSSPLYAPASLPKRMLKAGGTTIDADNYAARELDRVDWLITTNAPFQSAVPANFHLVRRTRSFRLYRRVGPTPDRVPAEGFSQPYAVLDCTKPLVKSELATHPRARVVPAPVMGPPWQGSISQPGHTATMRVRLPAGRWDMSLQYLSATGADVSGPGLHYHLPRYLGRVGAYWYGGTLRSHGGVVTVRITSRPRPWFGRLLGPTRGVHGAAAIGNLPLQYVAFTRHSATGRTVPSRQACGHWVDWLAAPA